MCIHRITMNYIEQIHDIYIYMIYVCIMLYYDNSIRLCRISKTVSKWFSADPQRDSPLKIGEALDSKAPETTRQTWVHG